jgi:signal transduction histidine kinase
MHPFEELKTYVGFSADDSSNLKLLGETCREELPGVVDRFYESIDANEGARAVLFGPEQIERLKRTLNLWLRRLCFGPHDLDYYEERLHIGRVHVRVRLPQQYMFTAMNLIRRDLIHLAYANFEPDRALSITDSINRIADMELAIMLGTYMRAHEEEELAKFGDVIVSHLPTSVILIDENGRVISRTPALPHLFSGPDVAGLPLASALHKSFLEESALDKRVDRLQQSRARMVLPRVDVEMEGRERNFRVILVPLEHKLAHGLIHIAEITEVITAESRLKDQQHLAHLGTLAATVAHEIRNPLAGISGTMQVIAQTLPSEDSRREIIGKVNDQVRRLDDLVNDLLQFARPVTAKPRRTQLNEVAHQVATQLASAGLGKTSVDGDGGANTDGGLLGQVVLNLTQNAWQAGAQAVQIQVFEGRMDIVDNGPGIPDDLRGKVFEPFFTTKTTGTGLGLSVAKKVVEAMGGRIALVDSPLGGAGFSIRLPVEK